jgi:hypothetical protein
MQKRRNLSRPASDKLPSVQGKNVCLILRLRQDKPVSAQNDGWGKKHKKTAAAPGEPEATAVIFEQAA